MVILLCALLAIGQIGALQSSGDRPFSAWSLSEAVRILNSSLWARQETFTTVVSGIGSGLSGEKEIYNRFYVRILSARPVLEAYARVLQIDYTYDDMSPEEKRSFDETLQALLNLDLNSWVVVTVSFRSNDPDRESQVRRYFLQQTAATLANKAFLSTDRFSQVKVQAYFPALDEGMGARFVFPRVVDGVDLLADGKGSLSFELMDIPIEQTGSTTVTSTTSSLSTRTITTDANQATPTILRTTFSLAEVAAEQAGRPGPAEARSLSQNASPDELQRIGEFGIPRRDLDSAFGRRSSKPFAETVNAFTARNRGRYYGSAYEYHRNDYFDARNFFDPVGVKLPEYKRNQFGGSLGWLITERLQAFGTFDGMRIIKGSTITTMVATPGMRMGDFSASNIPIIDPFTGRQFSGNIIPESRLSPIALRMLELMPLPNRTDRYPYFTNNQPRVENSNTATGRVDYQLNKDSKVFADYSFIDSYIFDISDMPSFSNDQYRRNHDLAITYNRGFGSSMVANIKLEYTRQTDREFSKFAFQSGLLDSLGIKGVSVNDPSEEGHPTFNITGYPVLGQPSMNPSPRFGTNNNIKLFTDITYAKGTHNLKYGFQVINNQMNDYLASGNRRGVFTFDGHFTGNAFADFLMGIPSEATRLMGSDRQDLRQRTWQAYVRDDWKINRKLTLSTGLTYIYYPLGHSIRSDVSLFWPLVFDPPAGGFERVLTTGSTQAVAAGMQGIEPGYVGYNDKNDFAPSVGLAYSPLGSNKLVIRASYGWTYQPVDVASIRNYTARNYPYRWDETAASPNAPTLTLSDPFRTSAPPELRIQAVDPNMRSAYIQTWRLAVQNEFRPGWSLEMAYEGKKSTRLARNTVANVPLPGEGQIQGRRPNTQFGRFDIYKSSGSSSGNKAILGLTKRLSNGFSIRSDFTWDRTFSDVPAIEFPARTEYASNPRNLAAERAITGTAPMNLSLNYIWDLPVGRNRRFTADWAGKLQFLLEGWQISGITGIVSGVPLTPKMRGDSNNDGVAGDRPDRIGAGILSSGQSVSQWFNTADFVAPGKYAFGNSGRFVLRAPGQNSWDVSLLKRTRISERGDTIDFRIQFFNAFNHTNLQAPGLILGTGTFGVITNANLPREIEIALKYTF